MSSVKLVGEGGGEWEYDLPLSEPLADQVKGGKLKPADDDSRDALAAMFAGDAAEEPAPDGGGAEPPAEKTLAEKIDAAASHAEMNALAAELGVDGFEEKKPNLNDKRAALHARAQELAAQ
jgi:hypothetical protein